MKSTQPLIALFALVGAALAAPAPDAGMSMAPRAVDWTGDNKIPALQARAKGNAERCTVGKAECGDGLGCYGCWGHQPVCQEGPGSSECCFLDDRGPTCQIIPIGK